MAQGKRPFPRRFRILILIAVLGVGAGFFVFASFSRSSSSPQKLLRDLSRVRPRGARFFNSPTPTAEDPQDKSRLGNAQLAVLALPDSAMRKRLQALVQASAGHWQAASTALEELAEAEPKNPEVLNDLGVVYMAMGQQNAVYRLKAVALFENAVKLAPKSAAPQFNVILASRTIGLERLANEAWKEYRKVETDKRWLTELENSRGFSESELIDKLKLMLASQRLSAAQTLFAANADTYRHIATDYAMNADDPQNIDPAVEFIASELHKRGDETIPAILAPLRTEFRGRVIESRKHVHAGSLAYLQSKSADSLAEYTQARAALKDAGSAFDELWIDLNQADTESRRRNNSEARRLLDGVIETSRRNNWKWLLGLALAARGSSFALADSYAEHSSAVIEAIDVLEAAGDKRDTARPLYYLAMTRLSAGDLEGSLQLVQQALEVIPPDDSLRRTEIYSLSGQLAARLGFHHYGTVYLSQAVAEARKKDNAQVVANVLTNLASVYESIGDYDSARKYFAEIKSHPEKIDRFEQMRVDINLNRLCARIERAGGNLSKAEDCLHQNEAILDSLDPAVAYLYSPQSELAKVHTLMDRLDLARDEFHHATDEIEQDDAYFANPSVRMSFENERRDIYDSAIAFEYDHGGQDAAWNYLQRYRSKLFLEFIGQLNPAAAAVHSKATQRNQAQKLMPDHVQVVEYLSLPDRLLIWLISDRVFTVKSVGISRVSLEEKVNDFIARIRSRQDVSSRAQELHELLIAPLDGLLEPSDVVAIIPDLSLHRLPFAALQDPQTKDYLVSHYTILESPNLTHLLTEARKTPERDSIVVFGSHDGDASSGQELSALAKTYSAMKSFTGDEAGKQAFLDAMKNASVFHYAGHSRDAANPLQSEILLDGNREGPNSVTALDVSLQRMRPNAVVVLASCDSSVGNSRDGIGVRGLTSAFLISGAGAVVGSLWPVDSAATSDLVIHFHEAYATGRIAVASALRQAQLRLLRSYPQNNHPIYWSGFVVTGNTTAAAVTQKPSLRPN